MVAQAIGGVLGSCLSDRIDLRTILTASMALAATLRWLPIALLGSAALAWPSLANQESLTHHAEARPTG